jgi:hypothetical protein
MNKESSHKMGYSTSATLSVGVKVKLIDFLDQIQEDNFDEMKRMMEKGFIEDEDYVYSGIFMKMKMKYEQEKNWEVFKMSLKNEVMEYDIYVNVPSGKKIKVVRKMLGELMYLIPEVEVMNMMKSGREESMNGKSRSLDLDLETIKREVTEKYAFLTGTDIVMMMEMRCD